MASYTLNTTELEMHDLGLKPRYEIGELAVERGIFSSDPEWVLSNATPLTRSITEKLMPFVQHIDGYHLVVDTRVQRLMPGMYPSIPGWHCDNVPRSDYFAQPDLGKINPNVRHMTLTVSTHIDGVSNTEFLLGHLPVRHIDPSESVWRQVHERVHLGIHDSQFILDGTVCIFGQDSVHRASPCVRRGWRLFYRLAMMDKPPLGNHHSNVEQVYILSEKNGW